MNSKIHSVFLITSSSHVAQIVLTRIGERHHDERIVVIVSESSGLHKFFAEKLSDIPNVHIKFLSEPPVPRLSRPKQWLDFKRFLYRFIRELNIQQGDELWYTGEFCSLMQAGLIIHAEKAKCKLVNAEHPQYTVCKLRPKFYETLRLFLERIVLKIPRKIVSIGTSNRIFFLDSKSLKSEHLPGRIQLETLKQFHYTPCAINNSNGKNIIFFESASGVAVYENYEKRLLEIFEFLIKQKFNIYIKPHPRLGSSSFLSMHPLIKIIPQAIPGELIDYASFSISIAIYSVALIHTANLGMPSFCIEHLFFRKKTAEIESQLQRLLCNPDLSSNMEISLPTTIEAFKSSIMQL